MKKLEIYIIYTLILFLIISFCGLGTIYNYAQFVTNVLTPLILVIALVLNKFFLISLRNTSIKIFGFILILGLFISPFSYDISIAFENLVTLLDVFFCMLITVELLNYSRHDFLEIFFLAFVFGFIIIVIHFFSDTKMGDINPESFIDRRQFDLNANKYSYFSYFSNIALFYLVQIKKRKIYVLLSFIFLFIGIYMSFITASRSGLIFTGFIGFIYWFFIYKQHFKVHFFIRLMATVIIIGIFLHYLLGFYNDSFLKTRFDQSISDEPRTRIAGDALNVFLTHPFMGVGPGQFYLFGYNQRSYSHNSFVEMAANFGIVGLVLLLMLFFKPLFKEINNRYFKDKFIRKLNILFFSSFILYNALYVFYLTPYAMIFFCMILMTQKRNFSTK